MSIQNRKKEQKIKNTLIENFLKTHHLTSEDLSFFLHTKKERLTLPITLFSLGLSPLQATVKYLKENKSYTFSEIAQLLNRDQRSIGNSYRQAQNKLQGLLAPEPTTYHIDLSIFSDRFLSFLEHLCTSLRNTYNLTYHQIALLLGKNDRTVWTACKRAEKKYE